MEEEIFQKLEETDFESEQSRREREYEQMRSIENCNKMRRHVKKPYTH